MKKIGAVAVQVLAVVGAVSLLGAVGTNPRYLEELVIGGGAGSSPDGGASFEKNGNITTDGNVVMGGDATVKGGDVTGGVSGSMRGVLSALQGSGGNTPGCLKLLSRNGTGWYLFVEDDGTVKVHSGLPANNTDGSIVGQQS